MRELENGVNANNARNTRNINNQLCQSWKLWQSAYRKSDVLELLGAFGRKRRGSKEERESF